MQAFRCLICRLKPIRCSVSSPGSMLAHGIPGNILSLSIYIVGSRQSPSIHYYHPGPAYPTGTDHAIETLEYLQEGIRLPGHG